ncbi:hypothetical protein ENSA5_51080 [Enhygromyxa salina]|uniref:Glycosyltransferase RgtA/B/C/D-like domain-containing protein n=1 Tax=Enhygromyxa salina TaxID=215803 RepID=A0A2S9XHL4_9BACT|nr:hypothetical protein [Enhygromyxa salina]PRP92161.1 hypothetical protein ENSA5_51080 [Enhygromyxa salina]
MTDDVNSSERLSPLQQRLGHRRVVWVVLALAFVLSVPSLGVGLLGDDLPQAEFLSAQREGASTQPWWDMFVLVSGPQAHNEALRTLGQLPWWTAPDLRVAFFRPLTVVTHLLDHLCWPRAPWLMHLHSVAWYLAACALVWVVARRLSSNATAAGVASLAYAAAFGHHVPVAWLAHRNGLVSAVFSLLTILAHDRWRRDQDKRAGWLAPVALVAALLAGEAGVVTLTFVTAYALVLDPGSRQSRALSLIPSVAVVIAWRAAYDLLGYGAVDSGAYLDPVGDPAAFLAELPPRYLALSAFSVSPPVIHQIPVLLWWLVTLVLLGLLAVFVARVNRPCARFGVLAAGLGCIPLTASLPFERLLILTSFGVALAWGELIDAWLLGRSTKWLARAGAVLVVAVHLVASPLAFFVRSLDFRALHEVEDTFQKKAWPGTPEMEGKTVVVVHTFHYLGVEYLLRSLRADGRPAPAELWVLHAGSEPPDIERLDDHTLELRAGQGWPAGPVTAFWRDPGLAPFVVGDHISTRCFDAEIMEVDAGKATRVRFHFEEPLDSPSRAWIQWHSGLHRKVNPGIW